MLSVASHAQVVPATPKGFTIRPIGGVTPGGVTVIPRDGGEVPKARYVTYAVLSVSRIWTSTEGKNIQGKLIAFEDMIVEAPKGELAPPSPPPPASPTVIRDGKVRLLVGEKPAVFPITRLIEPDREFIEGVQKAMRKKKPTP